MNILDLQLISRTETCSNVLKYLCTRPSQPKECNIFALKQKLLESGFTILMEDYFRFWQELELYNVGSRSDFSGRTPGTFMWNYNSQTVADQILNPNKDVIITSIGTHEQQELMPIIPVVSSPVARPVKKRKKRVRQKAVQAIPALPVGQEIIFIFTSDEGRPFPLKLREAERFVEHVAQIKSMLRAS